MSNEQSSRFRGPDPWKEATMSCDSVWELLSVYADGEASPQETAMVEAHIAVCADCARDLEFMRDTTVVLSSTLEVEPPTQLRTAILAATVNRPAFPARFREALRRALSPVPVRYGTVAAAGAALALAIVVAQDQAPVDNPVAYHPAPKSVAQLPPFVEPVTPIVPDSITQPVVKTAPAGKTPKAAAKHHEPALGTADIEVITTPHTVKIAPKLPTGKPNGKKLTPSTPAQMVADFKSKLTSPNDPATDLPDPDPVIMVPTPMDMKVAEGGMAETGGMETKADPVPTSTVTHLTLVAGITPDTSGQIASLADLKRSLKQRNAEGIGREIRESIKAKEIRVPVIRGRF